MIFKIHGEEGGREPRSSVFRKCQVLCSSSSSHVYQQKKKIPRLVYGIIAR